MNKPRSAAPIIAAVLLLLPVLYVGSYFALVVPQGVTYPIAYNGVATTVFSEERYRFANKQSARLFWPLEKLDRTLRPQKWNEFWLERDVQENAEGFSEFQSP